MGKYDIANAIVSRLRANLTDPITSRGENWIFAKEPKSRFSFPIIYVNEIFHYREKLSRAGSGFIVRQRITFRVYFTTKSGFEYSTGGVTYSREDLCRLYADRIATSIETGLSTIHTSTTDVQGIDPFQVSEIVYDEEADQYTIFYEFSVIV